MGKEKTVVKDVVKTGNFEETSPRRIQTAEGWKRSQIKEKSKQKEGAKVKGKSKKDAA